MKHFLTILAVVFSFNAYAVYLPGWNRPVESAKMEIQMAEGRFVNVDQAEVVLTKLDGQMQASQVKLYVNGVFKRYQIVQSELNIEGARVITAVDCTPLPETTYITLVDYRTHEQPERLWEVRVETIAPNEAIVGELVLQGTPQPVFTIQTEQPLVSF